MLNLLTDAFGTSFINLMTMREFYSEKLTEENKTAQFIFSESEESKLYRNFLNEWETVWSGTKEEKKNLREASEEERGKGCDKPHYTRVAKTL